jgi:hypothetical protein
MCIFDDDFDKLFGGDKPIGMFNQMQKVSAMILLCFLSWFGVVLLLLKYFDKNRQ